MISETKQFFRDYYQKKYLAAWLYFFCVVIYSMAMFREDTTLSTAISNSSYLGWLCSLGVIVCKLGNVHLDKTRKSLLVVIFIFYCITQFHVFDWSKYSIDKLIFFYLTLFALLNDEEWLVIYKLYKAFIIFQSVIGAICYISFILRLGLPFVTDPYYSGSITQFYLNYYFSYILLSGGDMLRLCGLFSEPGYLGKTIVFFLIADGFNLRKRSNLLMVPALIMSWSLAAFITAFFYLLVVSYKNRTRFATMILFILVALFVIPNIETNNADFNHLKERIKIEDGKMAGDDRSSEALDETFKKQNQDLSLALFGYGSGYRSVVHEMDGAGISSYKVTVVEHGWIGFFFMTILLFFVAFKYARGYQDAIALCLVWLFTRYGTSETISPQSFVFLLGGIAYIKFLSGNIK